MIDNQFQKNTYMFFAKHYGVFSKTCTCFLENKLMFFPV